MAAKKKLAAANAILHNQTVSQNEKVGRWDCMCELDKKIASCFHSVARPRRL